MKQDSLFFRLRVPIALLILACFLVTFMATL
jgi:hypothetical protein